jgi:fluoride ion exporter CrcB/FEX
VFFLWQLQVQQTDAALLVQGLQLGLLGCMSTVSTFVAELYLLHLIANKRWRAYAYAFIMLVCCFAVGVIAYTIPVLTRYSSQG